MVTHMSAKQSSPTKMVLTLFFPSHKICIFICTHDHIVHHFITERWWHYKSISTGSGHLAATRNVKRHVACPSADRLYSACMPFLGEICTHCTAKTVPKRRPAAAVSCVLSQGTDTVKCTKNRACFPIGKSGGCLVDKIFSETLL
jgi:hypothetical protein